MLNNVVDLSHHNSVTSFQEAKRNGIVGVIHKATQGRNFVDATYHARRARALANGLLWGAYHFGVRGNVTQQVEHFLETVNPTRSDLLVLDFEPNPIGDSGTMTLAEAEQFVSLVEQQTGRFPGLYSGQSFIRQKVGNNTATVLSNCFLWIARYSSQLPIVPPAWNTFTFWQYTDGNIGDQPHQVPGIGRCDRNKFNGSLAGLKRLWGVSESRTDIHSFRFNLDEVIRTDLATSLPQSLDQRLKNSLKQEIESRFPGMLADNWETNPFSVYTTLVDEAKDLVLVATVRVGNDFGITLTKQDKNALQAVVALDSTPKSVLPSMINVLL